MSEKIEGLQIIQTDAGPVAATGRTIAGTATEAAIADVERLATRVIPPSGSTTAVSDLIARAVRLGKSYVELAPDTVYDNTGGQIALPSGVSDGRPFELVGHRTAVLTRRAAGAAVVFNQWSKATKVDFVCSGFDANAALGGDPSGFGTSIEMNSHCQLIDCSYQGFWGLVLKGDHIKLHRVRAYNTMLALVRIGANSNGNLSTIDCDFTGALNSGFFVADTAVEDSWTDIGSHFGFTPFGLFGQNSGSPATFAFTNINLIGTSIESWGNRAIWLGTRKISGVMTQVRTGQWDLGDGNSGPQFFWAGGSPGDHNYAFESGNVDGLTSSDGALKIVTAGGDVFNGSFVGGGSTGVFHKTL